MPIKNRRPASRITAAFAALFIPLMLTAGIASPASATEPEPDWTPVYEYLSEYGVPAETQDAVVAKVLAGEILDSLRTGVLPVTSEEVLLPTSKKLVEKFADGSVRVTTLELPDLDADGAGVAARAITGCTYSSGTGYSNYTNCSVNIVTEMVTTKFKASYSRNVQFGHITAANTPQVLVYYGSASAPTVSIIRAKSGAGLDAVAQLHSRYQSATGASSEDLYLSLRVNATTATSTNY